jgi:hypothetical protein
MKKIFVAACLIFSTAAFSQNQQINNNNDHGQNDCQCTGIGIPMPNNKGSISDVAPGMPIPLPDKKKETNINSWWYAYVQIYLNTIRNQGYIKKEK